MFIPQVKTGKQSDHTGVPSVGWMSEEASGLNLIQFGLHPPIVPFGGVLVYFRDILMPP